MMMTFSQTSPKLNLKDKQTEYVQYIKNDDGREIEKEREK